ncbi:MAG: hypothetical protein CL491_00905 [Acinetobacter sp.]|uniref:hypothetical protein n=1 Tax=Acinetobacter sp. TaxID=472 RepID=UPI000C507A2E|nr:hypothetical protein [Acinetobacter sp.]MBT48650.1 hypothetical protein [Acinetobacter sp.]|tara:strand:- start:2714 stop:2926 length:213 start_codon:yes stop_codon:yes gene_type:complete
MSWDEEINETDNGSHDVEKAANRKIKPRFSVNLSDSDYDEVKEYAESISMSASALARMLLLKEVKHNPKN